jgi:hypothetical protein
MRAINHALTGALIGLTVGEPVVALPAALVSHFICDVIPHHGSQTRDNRILRSNIFRNTLYVDEALCVILVLILAERHPVHWVLAAACAFFATSPDLLYINNYLRVRKHKAWKPSRLVKWAIDIQWFQRPIGAVVEVAWFASGLIVLAPFLR